MSAHLADQADTRYVTGPRGERFAYRRFGRAGTRPLVLHMRLRGTIDHWDPALLDLLAAEREVVVFDNRGTNFSTGEPPSTMEGLVDGSLALIGALGLEDVDVLGWSLGGIVAQGVALTAPGLVNRLVVAGSSPGGVPDLPPPPARVAQITGKGANDDEDFLYLFYPETERARAAGLASLRRLDRRLRESKAVVSPEAFRGQIAAISGFRGYWDRQAELTLPVLAANGAHDVMIHAYATFAMSQRLPDAKAVLYSDAGHGFLFQHPEDFAHEVNEFLGR
ncbi:alpha/beta hydrolase [Streptomyces griseoviridis]|jgi:pimeloyl-ACP methyl ester carboxylesterase|uniref:Alpha/beta hydrolase n=3 Tax=Streptomyces TaxID=1883 RepID=A0A918GRC0_STRGD|nr:MULTISPECIES: alpha/beta hydrolase [Streptomyces]MDP9680314.1 pimeloyl-ACP methyl ester carboxylesterase [Streptomyces griseoviridis]GGS55501.1 alpha/beta hydrolase [Streptomyces niveoruber]GGT09497.1 alpha/beta hydrolase [Streptomyces griseoviridis]GGU52940.1 alpha/beta hydrolase [Streptomyces daghestanicus]GHI29170.1 alpha/beta hydrolase [Streptomyces daghestanicus]